MYGWKISVWRETWDSHSGNTNENHDKIPIHTLECLKLKRPGICKDVEAPQFLYMAGGDEKWCKHFGEQFGGFFFFFKVKHTSIIWFKHSTGMYLFQTKESIISHKGFLYVLNMCTDICNRLICAGQEMETN